VDFDPSRGSEQAGHRPAVIISVDSFNARMPVVVVAAITSKIKPALQVTVTLPAGKPLPQAGQILAFQVMTIDKQRLGKHAGRLDAAQIADLEKALRLSWGL
jgi:mRNA interferase MazF